MHERILLIDDEPDLLKGLARTLERNFSDIEIVTTSHPLEVLDRLQNESFDLALIDIRMPEINGLELLKKLLARDKLLTVVIMTAFASIELAVDAIRGGAYDFITKPFDKEILLRVVNKGLERNRLVRENNILRQRICRQDAIGTFIGASKPMRQFQERLKIVAQSDYTVLVRGESGTGKELAARALHSASKRRNHPLIMVNCPAIPENLLESELFGHKRGAFTGAERDHAGLFAKAHGGTICLDEIGDIPVAVQTKLLRVLQEQEIKPLGDNKTKKIDVRIIAITNQNLERKIEEHSFREDLFYRLNVVTLTPPALSEIREDIPLLVTHLTKQVCCELHIPDKQFRIDALESLKKRPWPGNVRELQNTIRQAVLFCPHREITANDLPPSTGQHNGNTAATGVFGKTIAGLADRAYKDAKEEILQTFTHEYMDRLLTQTEGNVSQAAEISGLTRAALQKIIRRYDIKADLYRGAES